MIRAATEEDAAEIRAMIRELADYERVGEQARTTEEQLREALFGEHPAAFALIAEDDGAGRVVGYALWFPRFSTWTGTRGMHLEDLYVRPSARGGGHGRALLAFLAAFCERRVLRPPAAAVTEAPGTPERHAPGPNGGPGEEDRTRTVMDAVLGGLRTGCGQEDTAIEVIAGQRA
ncbi:GNAT family N-acetyltransferase [Streptomyces prasinus]|uniref:GNAT family N-acetyltransferase n=1 Tax=Streptomyces prasinus TaxID=67345 RepID=UPI0033B222DE